MKRALFFVLVFAVCLSLCACADGPDNNDTSPTKNNGPEASEIVEYTYTVKSESGFAMQGVELYILSADGHPAAYCITNADGHTSAKLDKHQQYRLSVNAPDGCLAETHSIEGQHTDIVIKSQLINEDTPLNSWYDLGSPVFDFNFITTNGNNFRLSEVLKTKKAVLICFWDDHSSYTSEKLEIINEACALYKDDISVLAMPISGSERTAKEMANALKLSFDITASSKFVDFFEYMDSNVCIIIDRNGFICLKDDSVPRDAECFKNAFKYFSKKDYVCHYLYEDIEKIPHGVTPNECPEHCFVFRETIVGATCIEAGRKKGYCLYCASEMEDTYYLNHDYTFGVCVNCGKKENAES